MGLMKLLLTGVIGGGAAYLYRNPEARQKALTFGQDMMDTGLAMLPPKYAEKAAQLGLGRRGSTQTRVPDTAAGGTGPYTTTPSQTTYPSPTTGEMPGTGEI